MGARDVLMLVMGLACVPLALYDAYYGLLAYCWLSFMRPQTFVWAESMETARITFAVGAAMIFRAIFSDGPRVRWRWPTCAIVAVWAWFGVATFTSLHYELSWEKFVQFSKIGVAMLLLTGLVRTQSQLKWLMILIALCPGAYGLKLGQFFLRGAEVAIQGGPRGMDNNDAAMFIAMGIPLLVLVGDTLKNVWGRRFMYVAGALSVPAVILTTSRGGVLAMAVALALTVWRKATWWKAAILGTAVLVAILAIVPAETVQRVETIGSYEDDPSAMGRINAWKTCMAMAAARPLAGVGFGQPAYMMEYANYMVAEKDRPRAAHSIWFSLLAETGYVGLGLYVLMLVAVLISTQRVIRRAAKRGEGRQAWAWRYAAAVQASVVTFMVGGTFLSQATFEFIFAMCAISVPIAIISERESEPAPLLKPLLETRGASPLALGMNTQRG